jgi:hypothetical protein
MNSSFPIERSRERYQTSPKCSLRCASSHDMPVIDATMSIRTGCTPSCTTLSGAVKSLTVTPGNQIRTPQASACTNTVLLDRLYENVHNAGMSRCSMKGKRIRADDRVTYLICVEKREQLFITDFRFHRVLFANVQRRRCVLPVFWTTKKSRFSLISESSCKCHFVQLVRSFVLIPPEY